MNRHKVFSFLVVLASIFSFSLLSVCTYHTVLAQVPSGQELIVPPDGGAYSGAYIDFGDREDNVTLDAIEKYDGLVGKRQALIGFSSDWGMQAFPWKQMKVISAYGAVPLVYWSPWDRPLGAPRAQNRFSLRKILAGEWDSYIDMWSIAAKQYGLPMFVAWGLEMNGEWFPWSGAFFGADTPVPGSSPQQYLGPETFKSAYRYVVDRVRKNGVTNILWVFHANNTSDPEGEWNKMANYYPGKEYVDWLGMSAYGVQYPEQGWTPFDMVVPKPYKDLAALDPDKPIFLAEWGIGEFPKAGSKAAWLDEAFARLPLEFPRIKAAVYWHERWQNGNLLYSNLRVNSSPEALQSFQRGLANQYWLDRPIFQTAK